MELARVAADTPKFTTPPETRLFNRENCAQAVDMEGQWTRRSAMAALIGAAAIGPTRAFAVREAERLDPALFDGLLAPRGGAPGLGAAVVGAQGLRAVGTAGTRRLGASELIGINDQWHIGSNTKAFTAVLYALFVEAGRARWQMPIADLFPDVQVDAAWQRIPVEAVLSHSAGILDQPLLGRSRLSAAYRDRRPVTTQRTEFAQRILASPPAGPVGRFSYSNAGYMLIGAALERIAQTSWEQALSTKLFQPLGLASAGFFAPTGQQPWGHARRGSHLRPVPPSGLSDNPAVMGPSGQIHISLPDYAKFLRLFLNGGSGLLASRSIQHLSAPQPMQGGAYALGWEIIDGDWGQGTILAHQGSNTLWQAVAYLAPARGIGFVGVSNAAPRGSNQAARHLALRLVQRFAPVTSKTSR